MNMVWKTGRFEVLLLVSLPHLLPLSQLGQGTPVMLGTHTHTDTMTWHDLVTPGHGSSFMLPSKVPLDKMLYE